MLEMTTDRYVKSALTVITLLLAITAKLYIPAANLIGSRLCGPNTWRPEWAPGLR
jgi:hypothetical protein